MKRLWAEGEIEEILKNSNDLPTYTATFNLPGGGGRQTFKGYINQHFNKTKIQAFGLANFDKDSAFLVFLEFAYKEPLSNGMDLGYPTSGLYIDRSGAIYWKNSRSDAYVYKLALDASGLNLVLSDYQGQGFILPTTKIDTLKLKEIEYTGTISETAGGSTSIGTYTLRYSQILNIDGDIIGGTGTIALSFTNSPTTQQVYLGNSDTLPNVTGTIVGDTGAVISIGFKGQSSNQTKLTLSAIPNAENYEGGINIFNN